MSDVIVVLSGPIAAGKTSLATGLEKYGFVVLKTRELIQATFASGKRPDRAAMQQRGNDLDASDPSWIMPHLEATLDLFDRVVVDSPRRIEQIEKIRNRFYARVVHIHLEASAPELAARYGRREESTQYSTALDDETEKQVRSLREDADLVIDTGRCTKEDVLVRAMVQCGLRNQNDERLVDVLIGAQYGSEGKGHVVSYLAKEYDVLVRTGGANAGHTVIHGGKPHVFKLLPSGTLHAPDAKIVLGPGMNIDLPVLMHEIEAFSPLGRLFIDPNAWVVWDEDRTSEGGVGAKIGSTQQGVGRATARRITGRGESDSRACKYEELAEFIRPAAEVFDEAFRDGKRVLLEGTQGTGLSLYHGPYPYVTSRDTTAAGVMSEAGIPPKRIRKVVLVTRTNPIRVASPEGATSGPMQLELTWEEVSRRANVPADVLRERERTTTTKRLRRIAEFDWSLLHRAVSLNGPTDIALTFVDYIDHKNTDARRFDQLTDDTIRFIQEIERTAACPVSLITTRFHERSIIDRRAW